MVRVWVRAVFTNAIFITLKDGENYILRGLYEDVRVVQAVHLDEEKI